MCVYAGIDTALTGSLVLYVWCDVVLVGFGDVGTIGSGAYRRGMGWGGRGGQGVNREKVMEVQLSGVVVFPPDSAFSHVSGHGQPPSSGPPWARAIIDPRDT